MSHAHDLTIGADPTAEQPRPAREPVTAPPHDPVLALNILRQRFPTVCLWFGTSTRHWWAALGGRLLEAHTPQELGRRIDLASIGARDHDGVSAAESALPGKAPPRLPAENSRPQVDIRNRWAHGAVRRP